MQLTVKFKEALPSKETASKIQEIVCLLDEGYTEGKDIPKDVDWELELPYNNERKLILGSKINNH